MEQLTDSTPGTGEDAHAQQPPSEPPAPPPAANGNTEAIGIKRKRDETDTQPEISMRSSPTPHVDQQPGIEASSDEEHQDVLEINLDELEDETRCSVCLSIINNTRLVSVCMHRFCAACIETWLRNSKSNSCPACRKPLQSRRDCKPDPRFDELLRVLYGNVEEYEADVVMPMAAEATRVGGVGV